MANEGCNSLASERIPEKLRQRCKLDKIADEPAQWQYPFALGAGMGASRPLEYGDSLQRLAMVPFMRVGRGK
jgi:hypothetical protein